ARTEMLLDAPARLLRLWERRRMAWPTDRRLWVRASHRKNAFTIKPGGSHPPGCSFGAIAAADSGHRSSMPGDHGRGCDAEAISRVASQFLAARFCMSSTTTAVGQQSTLS